MASYLETGIFTMQVFTVDDNDYPMGQLTTPNSPANGTVYSPLLLSAPVSYTAAADTVESVQSFARQQVRANVDLGISSLGDGTLELGEYQDDFDALVMGYALDTATATALRRTGHNVNRSNPRRLMLGFTPGAFPSNTVKKYPTIFTWGTLRRGALGSGQGTGRNPNNRQYILKKFLSTRNSLGQLWTATTVNPDGGRDDEDRVYGDAPMMTCTYVDDSTSPTFATPYALEYTEHAGAHNMFYKNGVENKSSITSISGVTVTRTASSAGDKVVVQGESLALLNASY